MRVHSGKTEPRSTSTFRTQAGMVFLTDTICLPDSSMGLQRSCHLLTQSIILLLTVLGTPDIFAQSESIPVSFTLEAPQPSCSVAKLKDLNYGTLGRPEPDIEYGNGVNSYGYATFVDNTDFFTLAGVTKEGGTPTIGKLKITASNANTLTLTWDFPEELVAGDHEIEYLQDYAHSMNENGPWKDLGSHYSLTLPYQGVEAAGTHYFRIGGTLIIWYNTEPGHYTNTMTLSVSCPE